MSRASLRTAPARKRAAPPRPAAKVAAKSGPKSRAKAQDPSPSPRQGRASVSGIASNAHKRQDDIVDAAARVFAQKGFHGTATQDIADVLGIRQASLYYYFRSKEDALRIVCEKGAAGFHERAHAIVTGPGTSRVKLMALVAAHLEPLQERADYVRVFLRERQNLPPSSRKIINAHARGVEGCFEMVIAQGMAHGAFSPMHDTRLATLSLLAMVNAVAFWPEMKTRSVDEAAREIIQIALGGLTGIAWYDMPGSKDS